MVVVGWRVKAVGDNPSLLRDFSRWENDPLSTVFGCLF